MFFPAVLFAGAGAVSPTRSRSNRGRFSGDPHLPSSKPGIPAGLPGETARTCPGSRLSLQCPHRTGGSWLAEPASPPPMISPVPCQRGQEPPQGGGEKKLGVEKQRGKRRPEARLRGLRFDWVGELGWMLSNRSFPDWSRSSRAGFLNLPFRAPSRPLRLVLVFSSSTRYTKTRTTTPHTTSPPPSQPATDPASQRSANPRDPSPVTRQRERPGRHSLPLPCAVPSPVRPRLCVHCAAAATPPTAAFLARSQPDSSASPANLP